MSYAASAYGQEAIWCSLPRGIAIQKHQFQNLEALRQFSERVTDQSRSTKPYLLIARVEAAAQLSAFSQETGAKTSNFRPSHPYWYFYSNAPGFATHPEIRDLKWDAKKGAVLQLDAKGEDVLISGGVSTERNPIEYFVDDLNIGLIVTKGSIDLAQAKLFDNTTKPPLIINVEGRDISYPLRNQSVFDFGSSLTSGEVDQIALLNLMPTTPEEAIPWGFEPYKARRYAANGSKIARDLDRYGYDIFPTAGRERLIETVREARETGKTLILVGEAGPNGEGVRIPGSTEVLEGRDFSGLSAGGDIIALVCESRSIMSNSTGLSVTGVLMSNESQDILRVLLDHRVGPSLVEYLDIPTTKRTVTGTLIELVKALRDADQVPALTTLTVSARTPESLPSDTLNTPALVDPSNASTPSSVSSNTDDREESMSDPAPSDNLPWVGWIAAAGVVGGLAREVIRWRRLIEDKRADLYMRPKYLILSIVILGVSGCVAIIFVQLVPTGPFVYPVAFVCGAGVEEIVRQAAKLEVWTPPVPQKSIEFDSGASYLEFLRA